MQIHRCSCGQNLGQAAAYIQQHTGPILTNIFHITGTAGSSCSYMTNVWVVEKTNHIVKQRIGTVKLGVYEFHCRVPLPVCFPLSTLILFVLNAVCSFPVASAHCQMWQVISPWWNNVFTLPSVTQAASCLCRPYVVLSRLQYKKGLNFGARRIWKIVNQCLPYTYGFTSHFSHSCYFEYPRILKWKTGVTLITTVEIEIVRQEACLINRDFVS